MHPENTWRIGGGTAFEFPRGFKVAPDGYAVLIEFNPAKEPENPGNIPEHITNPLDRISKDPLGTA